MDKREIIKKFNDAFSIKDIKAIFKEKQKGIEFKQFEEDRTKITYNPFWVCDIISLNFDIIKFSDLEYSKFDIPYIFLGEILKINLEDKDQEYIYDLLGQVLATVNCHILKKISKKYNVYMVFYEFERSISIVAK